jgi:peptide/nickel transport system permease protein
VLGGLKNARAVGTMVALIWVPLMIYVMFGSHVPPNLKPLILLPAIPAVALLFVVAATSFKESTIAMVGLCLVFFWLFIAVTVPYLPIIDPNKPIMPKQLPLTFTTDHIYWLGTDWKGRDVLSRVLWGSQRIFIWGITATAVAYVVGAILGLIAGYIGGWWDEIISFVANVLLSFPVMVLYVLILTYLGASGFNLIIAVTFASAPGIMRIVRGLTLDNKSRDYVFAAQTRGENPFYIMVVELLPNVRGPLIVDSCVRLGYTTATIATLTFLGLGLPPPDPDWGLMIKEGANAALVFKYSYQLLVPALAVSSLILGFNLLADGLREISLKD